MTRQQHTEGFKAGIGLVTVLGILVVLALAVGVPILGIIDLFGWR